MMRNHKIVSTVNAMFLLGFVAQRIFFLFFPSIFYFFGSFNLFLYVTLNLFFIFF